MVRSAGTVPGPVLLPAQEAEGCQGMAVVEFLSVMLEAVGVVHVAAGAAAWAAASTKAAVVVAEPFSRVTMRTTILVGLPMEARVVICAAEAGEAARATVTQQRAQVAVVAALVASCRGMVGRPILGRPAVRALTAAAAVVDRARVAMGDLVVVAEDQAATAVVEAAVLGAAAVVISQVAIPSSHAPLARVAPLGATGILQGAAPGAVVARWAGPSSMTAVRSMYPTAPFTTTS